MVRILSMLHQMPNIRFLGASADPAVTQHRRSVREDDGDCGSNGDKKNAPKPKMNMQPGLQPLASVLAPNSSTPNIMLLYGNQKKKYSLNLKMGNIDHMSAKKHPQSTAACAK